MNQQTTVGNLIVIVTAQQQNITLNWEYGVLSVISDPIWTWKHFIKSDYAAYY